MLRSRGPVHSGIGAVHPKPVEIIIVHRDIIDPETCIFLMPKKISNYARESREILPKVGKIVCPTQKDRGSASGTAT